MRNKVIDIQPFIDLKDRTLDAAIVLSDTYARQCSGLRPSEEILGADMHTQNVYFQHRNAFRYAVAAHIMGSMAKGRWNSSDRHVAAALICSCSVG